MKFLLVAAMIALTATTAHAANYGSARVDAVTSIYDGDTFRANLSGPGGEAWPDIIAHRAPIRVAGVDTPELRASCDAEREAAREAKQFTVARLRGADEIRLEQLERGKFFRLVANVVIDGSDLGEMLIDAYWRQGAAVNPRATTPDQRAGLRAAVTMLTTRRGLMHDEAYRLVHQRYGVAHIDELSTE